MKKVLTLILLCCLLICVFAGCGEKEDALLTEEAAQKIALEALNVTESETSGIHAHVGVYDSKACYSFHITVEGVSREVVVDAATGDILHIGESSH